MRRMIPLPNESIQSLKPIHDSMVIFQLRMRLLEIDVLAGLESPEKLLNCFAIEDLVVNCEDWPRC